MREKRFNSYRSWLTWGMGIAAPFVLGGCDLLKPVLQELQELPPLLPVPSQPQASPSPAQSPATAEMEAQVRQQINEIRKQHGLTELRNNQRLAEVARRYSHQMAEQNFFSHTSPNGDTVAERVRSAGITYWIVGENLFKSVNIVQPVPKAVQGWMDSRGHRENILRPEYRETGIGVWRVGNTYYFTQLFLRTLSL